MTPAAAIWTFLQPLTTLNPAAVIWAQQDAARPQKPYVALQVVTRITPEHETYLPVSADGDEMVTSNHDLRVQVDAYGAGSNEMLDGLRQRLLWHTSIDAASRLDIAVFDRGPVRDMTAVVDQSWEERAMLEIGIRVTATSLDQVGLITSVNVPGTTTGGSGAPTGDIIATVHVPAQLSE